MRLDRSTRALPPLALLGLVLFAQAALLFDLSGRVAVTIDEEVYIAAGIDQVVRGNHRRNPEHPPFAKDLIGLAVRAHDPDAGSDRSPEVMESVLWSKSALEQAAVLRSARLPSMGFGLLTTVVAFWGATLLAGWWAGLLAAVLFAFSPLALAHGALATLDAAVTCTTTLAFVATYQAWRLRPRWRPLGAVVAGFYLGLALGTKLTALYALPVIFGACVVAGLRRKESRATLAFLLLGLLATAVTLWATHHFSVTTVRGFPVPMNRYFRGLEYQLQHAATGHLNYLWGEVGGRGWWYYFVVGLAVKVPHSTQLLFLLSGFAALWPGPGRWARLERYTLALAYPVLLFLCMSFASTVQIGLKYLLPAAPLVHVAIASSVTPRGRSLRGRVLLGALILFVVAAPLRIHPHQLMYYNELAGGPDYGWQYTVHGDDLGQDQNRVAGWMEREGVTELSYAQISEHPEHFGIPYRRLACTPSTGVAALHVIELVRPSWSPAGCFDWLQGRVPDDKIGFTVFIYRIEPAEVAALARGLPPGEPPLERWGSRRYVWTRERMSEDP